MCAHAPETSSIQSEPRHEQDDGSPRDPILDAARRAPGGLRRKEEGSATPLLRAMSSKWGTYAVEHQSQAQCAVSQQESEARYAAVRRTRVRESYAGAGKRRGDGLSLQVTFGKMQALLRIGGSLFGRDQPGGSSPADGHGIHGGTLGGEDRVHAGSRRAASARSARHMRPEV